jgi:PmbA protein
VAELAELASEVVALARGDEAVEAYLAWGRETVVRAFEGELEQLTSSESAAAGIRVVLPDGRQGLASVGCLDRDALASALAEARDNARFGTPDPHVALAEPDGVEPAPLELWRDGLAGFPTEAKIALALELERAVRGADARIHQVEQATYRDAASERAVATTTGLLAAERHTSASLVAYAIARERDDTETGLGVAVGREPGELDAARVAADAARRATRLLGARKPASARLTVVLEPRVTATLLSVLGAALSGEAVAKGRSPFADRLGEAVAPSSVQLFEDPTDPAAPGAARFDAEGLACRRVGLVDRGVLASFLYDTTSARRAGAHSTASAVRPSLGAAPTVGCRALRLEPGGHDPASVLALVGEGLLVQSVSGVHSGVNPVSGDFSVGVEGLMIKGGELAEPVREATIASTIQRMLLDVVAVGNDLEWLPGVAAGVTLAIGQMSLGGS